MSVANVSVSKLTTSGATNSGVPKTVLISVTESSIWESPKSITLIDGKGIFSTKRIFSGCNNKTD